MGVENPGYGSSAIYYLPYDKPLFLPCRPSPQASVTPLGGPKIAELLRNKGGKALRNGEKTND